MLKVSLIAHTPEPEKVVAAAAKLCYSNAHIDDLLDGLTPEKSADFVRMLARMGHESPTEHASFTFAIEGVSRSLLAQITRHRIASFSVQSQRYVNEKDFTFVTPPQRADDPEASSVFQEAMSHDLDTYRKLTALLKEKRLKTLLDQGVSATEAEKAAEKTAIEDARFVLPNACSTKMILTMNARSLLHFFELRCCNRAQWEIRELAEQMLRLVLPIAPTLFCHAGPSCVRGGCSEGKMTCGKAKTVRTHYQALVQGFVDV